MTNLHKIRARIRSVNSTQQITRTMKMIAVSKLRKTQTSLAGVRLFADKGQEVLNALLADDVTFEHPYLTPRRRVGHVCYVVFWGNRGLCGAYNQVLLRHLEQLVHAETRPCSVIVCGRWGRDVLAGTNLPVREICAGLSDTPTMAEALEIAETLKNLYRTGEVRRTRSTSSTSALTPCCTRPRCTGSCCPPHRRPTPPPRTTTICSCRTRRPCSTTCSSCT